MYPKTRNPRPENVKLDGFFVYIAKTRLASAALKAKKAYARGASLMRMLSLSVFALDSFAKWRV